MASGSAQRTFFAGKIAGDVLAPGEGVIPPALDLSPEEWLDRRLSDFFHDWFLPIVLLGESRVCQNTIKEYRTAIDWWIVIAGDPPLRLINEFLIWRFVSGLKGAKYRRGRLGPEHPLLPHTQAKILTMIRAILYRLGPATDAKRPTTKSLLPLAPAIVVSRPKQLRTKPWFEIERARAVAAATSRVVERRRRSRAGDAPRIGLDKLMLGSVSAFYYTGLRSGTILPLEWSMLREERGDFWLYVPEGLVRKTSKAIVKFVHPAAAAALEPLRASGSEKIFDWRLCYSAFIDEHERLQELAGIPAEEWLSPHAWRRTFSRQIGLAGLHDATRAAQLALDHESIQTTREFYCDLEPELIRRMPLLVEPQARLF
jgi:integrase